METIHYLLHGYVLPQKEKDFCFLVPVFTSNGDFYRSVSNSSSDTIRKFIELDESVKFEVLPDVPGKEFHIGQRTYYMFKYKNNIYKGSKAEISIELLKLIRKKKLSGLQLYDVYFFLGYSNKLKETLSNFLAKKSLPGISVDNFMAPSEVEVNIDEFEQCIYDSAKILEYRTSFLPFENLFKAADDNHVKFLRYIVPTNEIRNNFHNLINKFESPCYRDLIVHFFVQNNLDDAQVKSDPGYKLRKLIPIGPVDLNRVSHYEELYKNTQSIFKVTFNALVKAADTEKKIANSEKVNDPDQATIDEKLKALETLMEKIKSENV